MTDLTRDPEFLRIYYSADKEWPGCEDLGSGSNSFPLLISEIYRLIPYKGLEYVHFHPKNMPDVKIDKVEIIGIVTNKTDMMKYISYTVDDSTGGISVLCKKKSVNRERTMISKKSGNINAESELKLSSELLSGAPYSYEMHMQNLWRRARYEEPQHDEIELYDYVHAIGFCAMTFRHQKNVAELTDVDLSLGRLFFFGLDVRRISEADHNAMMKSLIIDVARKRYLKPKV